MSSTVAQIYEHSSRHTPDGLADPDFLFYGTLIVQSSDIADVVKDIQFLRCLAESADPRIKPLLMKRVDAYKSSLRSLSSVQGKMLDKLTTTTQAYHYSEKGPPRERKISDIIRGLPEKQSPLEMPEFK